MLENCPEDNPRKTKYEVNPFIQDVMHTLKETIKTKREFVNGERGVSTNIVTNSITGEVTGETALMRFKKVDTEQFTKIYSLKVKNFFSMPTSANKVFEYILTNLQKDQDQIYLYETDLMDYSKQSAKSCLRGTQWLLDNKILARTTKPYWFFINPSLFFNGDRVTLMEVYQKEGANLDKLQQLPENAKFLSDNDK